MVGGTDEALSIVEPILDALATPEGLLHVGPTGSGHFVKLTHNMIEFGMVQSIGEGVELLDSSEYELNFVFAVPQLEPWLGRSGSTVLRVVAAGPCPSATALVTVGGSA